MFIHSVIFFDCCFIFAFSKTAAFLFFLVYLVVMCLIVYNPVSYAVALVFLYFILQRKKDSEEFARDDVRDNFSRGYNNNGGDISTDASETASSH